MKTIDHQNGQAVFSKTQNKFTNFENKDYRQVGATPGRFSQMKSRKDSSNNSQGQDQRRHMSVQRGGKNHVTIDFQNNFDRRSQGRNSVYSAAET